MVSYGLLRLNKKIKRNVHTPGGYFDYPSTPIKNTSVVLSTTPPVTHCESLHNPNAYNTPAKEVLRPLPSRGRPRVILSIQYGGSGLDSTLSGSEVKRKSCLVEGIQSKIQNPSPMRYWAVRVGLVNWLMILLKWDAFA